MKIGIDIDDTITNSWQCIIPLYSKEFNIPIEELEKSKPYYGAINHLITIDEYYELMKGKCDSFAANVELKENVKETLTKLHNNGYEIIFITARGKEHKDPYQLSKDYLDKHQIPFDKLIVDSKDKSIACIEEEIDIFIDDSLKHCKEVAEKGFEVLLFETNYNKEDQEFKHMKDWNEIYEYIKNR